MRGRHQHGYLWLILKGSWLVCSRSNSLNELEESSSISHWDAHRGGRASRAPRCPSHIVCPPQRVSLHAEDTQESQIGDLATSPWALAETACLPPPVWPPGLHGLSGDLGSPFLYSPWPWGWTSSQRDSEFTLPPRFALWHLGRGGKPRGSDGHPAWASWIPAPFLPAQAA